MWMIKQVKPDHAVIQCKDGPALALDRRQCLDKFLQRMPMIFVTVPHGAGR